VELSYADRLRMRQINALKKPHTKHQKKMIIRDKVKKVNKIKKRILKMIQNQRIALFPQFRSEEDSKIEENGGDALKSATQKILDQLNQNMLENPHENGVIENGVNEGEDKVIEISSKKQKKKKNRKRKALSPSDLSTKKVSFELEKNKTKEFFMYGKVSLDERPKSKELRVRAPGIIKKSMIKNK
jgi:hypothetical protein